MNLDSILVQYRGTPCFILRSVSRFSHYDCQYLLVIDCIESLICMNVTTFIPIVRDKYSLNTIHCIIIIKQFEHMFLQLYQVLPIYNITEKLSVSLSPSFTDQLILYTLLMYYCNVYKKCTRVQFHQTLQGTIYFTQLQVLVILLCFN